MVYIYIYIYICTTFTPHFNGKRKCISGIITLLSVLRNALTRNGGSILPPILINAFQAFSEII